MCSYCYPNKWMKKKKIYIYIYIYILSILLINYREQDLNANSNFFLLQFWSDHILHLLRE
jgi:hypothetical protein